MALRRQVWASMDRHRAFICAGHPDMLSPSLSFLPQVWRSVRSTSAASRRDAERARHKLQVPSLASKAFLSLKSLALKAYLKARLEIEAKFAFPPSYNPSPQGRSYRSIDPKIGDDRSCWQFFSIFCPSKLQSKFCSKKMSKKK